MDGYTSEQEQIDQIKKWWDANGKAIVFGLVLGLGGLFGYRYYESAKIAEGQAASVNYEHLLTIASAGGGEEATAAGQAIIDAYPKTTYAKLSALVLAKLAVDLRDLEQAKTRLQWVVDTSPNSKVKPVAQIRLAQVHLANGDSELASAVVAEIDPEFAEEFNEVRGDVYLATGDVDKARAMYSAALEEIQKAGQSGSGIQLKLDNLALANR